MATKTLGSKSFCCRAKGRMKLPKVRRCSPRGLPIVDWEVELWVSSLRNGLAVLIEDISQVFDPKGMKDPGSMTCEMVASHAVDVLRGMRPGITKVRVSVNPVKPITPRGVEVIWAL